MNRYQLEIAEMDRRHALMMRGVRFVGAACVIAVALWSTGLPPVKLWERTEQWFATFRKDAVHSVAPAKPGPAIPMAGPVTQQLPAVESLAGTDSSISATPLPLYLLSTAPGRNSRDGTALIGTSPTTPQTYSAGALLANGAQLAEIYRDYVMLKRGDRSARLSLHRLSDSSTTNQAQDDLLSVGGQAETQTLVPTSREVLTDYLRPSPIYDGEVLSGYQVYPGRKSAVFAQMGLQPGDVITAINDAPLFDPAQAMQVFQQIVDGVAVVATIERKNTTQRLTLDGALIAADQDLSRNAYPTASSAEHPSQI